MGYTKLSTLGLEQDEAADSPYGFRGNPEARASCCGRLFVHWLWPLLMLGQRRKLEQSDMYPLMPSERSAGISEKFEHEWTKAEGTSGAAWRRMLVCGGLCVCVCARACVTVCPRVCVCRLCCGRWKGAPLWRCS